MGPILKLRWPTNTLTTYLIAFIIVIAVCCTVNKDARSINVNAVTLIWEPSSRICKSWSADSYSWLDTSRAIVFCVIVVITCCSDNVAACVYELIKYPVSIHILTTCRIAYLCYGPVDEWWSSCTKTQIDNTRVCLELNVVPQNEQA